MDTTFIRLNIQSSSCIVTITTIFVSFLAVFHSLSSSIIVTLVVIGSPSKANDPTSITLTLKSWLPSNTSSSRMDMLTHSESAGELLALNVTDNEFAAT